MSLILIAIENKTIIKEPINIKDKSAFKLIFDAYYTVLCQYLYTFTSDKQLIEDCVQDVFLKIWNKKSDIVVHNIKSYLFIAVKNSFLDANKKIIRKNKYLTELSHQNLRTDDKDEVLQRELTLKQKIYCSIRHLPPKTKIIFERNKLNGLTYTEIAADMNISVKTVEAHITKALKFIRTNLKA